MRIPDYAKPVRGTSAEKHRIKALLRAKRLHTVCESARCPNIGECFARKTATFMILGDICSFCAVKHGRPESPDQNEPQRVAEAALALRLKHVVITSVTRDDLSDGGAFHWVRVIEQFRRILPDTTLEALIPDFGGNELALGTVINAGPNILNHNIETVPRLYPEVRPQASYSRSIEIISRSHCSGVTTKSGLMLGMGEQHEEVIAVMADLREAGCDLLTLGQYLRPSRFNRPVARYLQPTEFDEYRAEALKMGFRNVAAAPLVRSSYHADEM
jgi:lipoic acid synthetase